MTYSQINLLCILVSYRFNIEYTNNIIGLNYLYLFGLLDILHQPVDPLLNEASNIACIADNGRVCHIHHAW